ncbi:unnamed protein product [Rangifer tarandus platyrhynchus]|uniref:Uncharacterized protein n=1 Tax=Rangifer tarandus platyrhynchus TaxID=3082113 RepID=A0AC59ZYD9_RANTA
MGGIPGPSERADAENEAKGETLPSKDLLSAGPSAHCSQDLATPGLTPLPTPTRKSAGSSVEISPALQKKLSPTPATTAYTTANTPTPGSRAPSWRLALHQNKHPGATRREKSLQRDRERPETNKQR